MRKGKKKKKKKKKKRERERERDQCDRLDLRTLDRVVEGAVDEKVVRHQQRAVGRAHRGRAAERQLPALGTRPHHLGQVCPLKRRRRKRGGKQQRSKLGQRETIKPKEA